MASFTDRTGTPWDFDLTVGHLAPLKALGLDLSRAIRSQDAFASLFDIEPETLVDALYLLCEVESASLAPEDFARRFDGPAIERATEALALAVIDFFPRQKIAQALRGNLQKALGRMDREVVEKIERMTETDSGSNGSAGSSPDPSASTPAP
jgi:hypothetical protein